MGVSETGYNRLRKGSLEPLDPSVAESLRAAFGWLSNKHCGLPEIEVHLPSFPYTLPSNHRNLFICEPDPPVDLSPSAMRTERGVGRYESRLF